MQIIKREGYFFVGNAKKKSGLRDFVMSIDISVRHFSIFA
jgi:hypothetical protein